MLKRWIKEWLDIFETEDRVAALEYTQSVLKNADKKPRKPAAKKK